MSSAPRRAPALGSKGQRTMRRLLDAATMAFGSLGYDAARVDDIVAIAETSHGTFYRYFKDKEDVLRTLVSESLTRPEFFPTFGTREPPLEWEVLRDWVGQISAIWHRASPLFPAATQLAGSDRQLRSEVRRALKGLSRNLGRLIVRSGGAQDIDPDVAGMAMWAMVDRFHSLRQITGDPVRETDLDALTTMLHRALFSAPPRSVGRPGGSARSRTR
jgi:AcrR family transcriptional regulator